MLHRKIKSKLRKSISTFALCALVMTCSVTPAFAAAAPAGMFSALNEAFQFVRSVLLVGAAVSVVSYAFSFFMVAGGRDDGKKITAARKKLLATCIACASLFLLPTVMVMGKNMVSDMKWQLDSHIITPADTSVDRTWICCGYRNLLVWQVLHLIYHQQRRQCSIRGNPEILQQSY